MHISPQITPVFATPIVTFDVPDSQALNRELRRVIEDRADRHPGTQHSNQGGWQSTWDMQKWGGAPALQLMAYGRNVANRVTTDRTGIAGQGPHPGFIAVTWRANMWANINRGGHSNEMHWHRAAFWSGVYYVDDGGIEANPELGGELEFLDPRGPVTTMMAPDLGIDIPGNMQSFWRLTPKAGRLVLFPSWLLHQVRPYRGNAQRVSIAFNLTP